MIRARWRAAAALACRRLPPLRLLVLAWLLSRQAAGQHLRRLGRRWDNDAAARLPWWREPRP